MWERVCKNPHDPEIIVIDPRATETAQQSTLHIPLKPKSDLVLLYGLARELIERGWVDLAFIENHTADFHAFAKHVSDFNVSRVLDETNLSASQFDALIQVIRKGKRVSFWWDDGGQPKP